MRARYTDTAARELVKGIECLTEHAPSIAAEFADAIEQGVREIAEFRFSAQETEKKGVRRKYVRRFRYSVFYAVEGSEIVILHIRLAAQPLPWMKDIDNLSYRKQCVNSLWNTRQTKEKYMPVIAIFKYDIKPGRLPDFLKKLAQAAEPNFAGPVMPKSVRMFRSTVPGPDHGVVLMIEYEDMAAYGARAAFENANAEWRKLFEPARDSPESLVSVELLTEIPPGLVDTEPAERLPFGFRPA